MTGYIGQLLLLLAGANALLAISWRRSFITLHTTSFLLLAAFLWLIYGHLNDDFSLVTVFLHSHTTKPLLYKIAGAWGNHEGSFLLWLTLLALCMSVAYHRHKNPIFATMGQLTLFTFISFVLISCDPFAQNLTLPLQGRDLNPLLQDPLLAIHPPCLYLGYVSFAIPFLWALTGALTKDLNVTVIRQWSLWGWTFLTIGIILGAFWAYYELGWGGWWAWDPVENAALVPWLCATAQIHLLWLAQRRPSYIKSALVVVTLTWASCLAGTILVRSGLLTSVHTFAVDPERGTLLTLIASCLMIAGTFILKSYFHTPLKDSPKSSLYLLLEAGCSLLMIGWFTVLLGTFYPVISEVMGLPITVGTPYFELTFIPLMLPILVLMALLPDISRLFTTIPPGLIAGGFVLMFSYWYLSITHVLSLCALGVSTWLLYSSLKSIWDRGSLKPVDMGHGGFALMIMGMTLSLNLSQDLLIVLSPGKPAVLDTYDMELKSVLPIEGPNYSAQQALIEIRHKGHVITTLKPEKRFYHPQQMIHGESSFFSHGWHHVYAVLGDAYEGNLWSIHFYIKPWINLMLLGGVFMVISGLFALMERRKKYQFIKKEVVITSLALTFALPSLALEAHEQLSNPRLEKIATELGDLLLCPTCAGQSLNDSPSPTAQELRLFIRNELVRGQTRQQIIESFQDRFGPQVYRKPPFQGGTVVLWMLPWIALLAFLILGWRRYRQKGVR